MFPRLVENCGSCLRTSVALLDVAALRTLQTPASLAHLLDGGLDEAGGGRRSAVRFKRLRNSARLSRLFEGIRFSCARILLLTPVHSA